ncbi:MAG: ABC transporter ATP-binding protein [Candidatus Dormibacteraeota bacterium]|nr:ABC transporter ATP-binding protein [Candidatus Dormibacteraeota bacterium]
MPEAIVELVQASKRYGTVEALKPTDLAIPAGQLVAILGPNGAGKTTAISLMLGLRKVTTGKARLFGLEPADRRARSRCGVMLQESGINDVLKVREVVDLFRSYYPHPLSLDRALGLAGLADVANRKIEQLSGGQKQRVYYALAVCGDPDVIFLDEPTVGMDVEARRAFIDSIREFFRGGKTILLTTHYLEEADLLAERIVVIDRGVIIADATPAQIKSQVAGKRVRFTSDRKLTKTDFAALPVTHLQIEDDHVTLLSNKPEEILRALFADGIGLRNLEVAGADLEEAFLALTAHSATGRPA